MRGEILDLPTDLDVEVLTIHQASALVRFFVQLQRQIDIADAEHRYRDAAALSKLYGALHYRSLGLTALNDSFGEGL